MLSLLSWISLPRTDIILLLRAIGHHRQIGLESLRPGKMYLSHLQNLFVETAKCICRNRKMYLSRFQSAIGHHIYADRFGGRQLGGCSHASFLPDAFLFALADGFLQNKQTLWSASLHFFITYTWTTFDSGFNWVADRLRGGGKLRDFWGNRIFKTFYRNVKFACLCVFVSMLDDCLHLGLGWVRWGKRRKSWNWFVKVECASRGLLGVCFHWETSPHVKPTQDFASLVHNPLFCWETKNLITLKKVDYRWDH